RRGASGGGAREGSARQPQQTCFPPRIGLGSGELEERAAAAGILGELRELRGQRLGAQGITGLHEDPRGHEALTRVGAVLPPVASDLLGLEGAEAKQRPSRRSSLSGGTVPDDLAEVLVRALVSELGQERQGRVCGSGAQDRLDLRGRMAEEGSVGGARE